MESQVKFCSQQNISGAKQLCRILLNNYRRRGRVWKVTKLLKTKIKWLRTARTDIIMTLHSPNPDREHANTFSFAATSLGFLRRDAWSHFKTIPASTSTVAALLCREAPEKKSPNFLSAAGRVDGFSSGWVHIKLKLCSAPRSNVQAAASRRAQQLATER